MEFWRNASAQDQKLTWPGPPPNTERMDPRMQETLQKLQALQGGNAEEQKAKRMKVRNVFFFFLFLNFDKRLGRTVTMNPTSSSFFFRFGETTQPQIPETPIDGRPTGAGDDAGRHGRGRRDHHVPRAPSGPATRGGPACAFGAGATRGDEG